MLVVNTAWGTNSTRPEVEGRQGAIPASGSTLPELLREQELLGTPVCRCLCSIVCAMLTAGRLGWWVLRSGQQTRGGQPIVGARLYRDPQPQHAISSRTWPWWCCREACLCPYKTIRQLRPCRLQAVLRSHGLRSLDDLGGLDGDCAACEDTVCVSNHIVESVLNNIDPLSLPLQIWLEQLPPPAWRPSPAAAHDCVHWPSTLP